MLFKIIVFVLAMCLSGSMAQLGDAPCEVNDKPCIRNFLATYSSCDPNVVGKVSATLSGNNIKYYVPYFNMSHHDIDVSVKNMDKCTIAIIYRNETLHTTVLGIDCKNIHVEAERRFKPERAGRINNQVYTVRVVADYANVKLSINMHGDIIDICRERAVAFVSIPILFLQGRDTRSVEFTRNDPYGMFKEHLDVWTRELWVERAKYLFYTWINSVLCDFRCKYVRKV